MHARARRSVPPRRPQQAGSFPRQVQGLRLSGAHPLLAELVARARRRIDADALRIGIVDPGDAAALSAAREIALQGIARPLLIGEPESMARAADAAQVDLASFEIVASAGRGRAAAARAVELARGHVVGALMKGSLHTDELMSAVVDKAGGLRGKRRISHVFVFDLPRYPKLLALADCVVNIAPDVATKRDILTNAIELLRRLGIGRPKVGILAAVETPNPAIQATLDARMLVEHSRESAEWGDAIVEGPLGFDNAISAAAARIKGIDSQVAGNADLLLVPDLNAGNMLYKSFIYMGGGECAGVVLGASVPIVLTSRAESLTARVASAALAVLAA